MKTAQAYAPAAISGIFRAWHGTTIEQTGSTGVGFTINKGIVATVFQSKTQQVIYNGRPITFPTVVSVLSYLTKAPLAVSFETDLPLGVGFGMSGAAALATAYAVNTLLALGKTPDQLLAIAHRAEIENKTGLGTVGTQYTGGLLIKTKPGIPVSCKKVPFETVPLYSFVFGAYPTQQVLSKNTDSINDAADAILTQINNNAHPTSNQLINASYVFSRRSKLLLPHLDTEIKAIQKNGGYASMHMLGNAIFSTLQPRKSSNARIYTYTITNDTVHAI